MCCAYQCRKWNQLGEFKSELVCCIHLHTDAVGKDIMPLFAFSGRVDFLEKDD